MLLGVFKSGAPPLKMVIGDVDGNGTDDIAIFTEAGAVRLFMGDANNRHLGLIVREKDKRSREISMDKAPRLRSAR